MKIIRKVLELWGEIDDINAKLRCLILVRSACEVVTPQIYEKIMKKAYLNFSASTRAVTWKSYDKVSFLVNGLAELCSIRPLISYIIVFGILRSLAAQVKKYQTDGVIIHALSTRINKR